MTHPSSSGECTRRTPRVSDVHRVRIQHHHAVGSAPAAIPVLPRRSAQNAAALHTLSRPTPHGRVVIEPITRPPHPGTCQALTHRRRADQHCMSSTEAHPTLTARLLWAHAADMMRGLPQQLSRLRHHRLTSVVFLVVDALLLALITHGYLYTTQPDLLAFYGPTWDPDVQNRLFWWLVPIYIALGLAVRAFVWLWRHRSRAGSASQQ